MSYPTPDRETFLSQFKRWAENQPAVRAAILTSTLAIPGAPVDVFSDYDIILVLTDITPFWAGRGWLAAFGEVLALYRDPLDEKEGSGFVIQFEDNLKIDFSLWPVEKLRSIAAGSSIADAPRLSEEFDAGYRVLLDKDGLTTTLQPPTHHGYIPRPPSEAQYRDAIENFFVGACYVAKFLWRGDLVAAKYILDGELKQEGLLTLLTWQYEIENNWAIRPGILGRRLQHHLRPELLADLYRTYTGADPALCWEALFASFDLLRKAGLEVGAHLGYTYPQAQHDRVIARLNRVREQDQ
jgi:aminoglycoside 6-adenylyltransferase